MTAESTFLLAPPPVKPIPEDLAGVDIPADEIPKPTTTSLERIKAKLAAEAAKENDPISYKLPVPMRPHIIVEYGPIDQTQWNGLVEVMVKTKMAVLDMQARALATFCRGIYIKDDETGELFSADVNDPSAPAPRFDERLARSLGIPYGGVIYEFVKAVYKLDGGVLSTCAALMDLSGYGAAGEIEASAEGK